jgi:hypothetical protein
LAQNCWNWFHTVAEEKEAVKRLISKNDLVAFVFVIAPEAALAAA